LGRPNLIPRSEEGRDGTLTTLYSSHPNYKKGEKKTRGENWCGWKGGGANKSPGPRGRLREAKKTAWSKGWGLGGQAENGRGTKVLHHASRFSTQKGKTLLGQEIRISLGGEEKDLGGERNAGGPSTPDLSPDRRTKEERTTGGHAHQFRIKRSGPLRGRPRLKITG